MSNMTGTAEAPDRAEGGQGAREDAAPVDGAAPAARCLPEAWMGDGAGPLAAGIALFNRYPLRYAHESWIPASWERTLLESCRDGGRSETRLGEELLRHWKLDPRPCFAFGAPLARFALVEPESLRRTVSWTGLARHADEISRMVERSKVMAFRNQVGEEAWRFSVFRAPLLAGSLASGSRQGGKADGDWSHRAMASGLLMLGACLAGSPSCLSGRVALKFPREFSGFLEAGKAYGEADGYFRLFRRILVQEVDPAWDSLLS
ncbi:MAG: type secretion protein [Fibrobacteres bacterium]|nr:type secretion protein [Fibrobacterota bacterium]